MRSNSQPSRPTIFAQRLYVCRPPARHLSLLFLLLASLLAVPGPSHAADRANASMAAAPAPSASRQPPRFRKLEALLQVPTCEVCGEVSVIAAGAFTMGSPASERGRREDEGPMQRVHVQAFEISRTTVTQSQWRAVMGTDPSHFKACGDACPLDFVTWNGAQAFLRKLNQLTGKNYRLPSEAEWEYAVRAGTKTAFSWGSDSIDASQANYDANYAYNDARGEGRQRTMKSDSFAPNPWGLYNVHGNVLEWVQDCYHESYAGLPLDGRSWQSACNSWQQKVLRNGGLWGAPNQQRSAARARASPDLPMAGTGFRIAHTVF